MLHMWLQNYLTWQHEKKVSYLWKMQPSWKSKRSYTIGMETDIYLSRGFTQSWTTQIKTHLEGRNLKGKTPVKPGGTESTIEKSEIKHKATYNT